jgi:hypothetical protein
MESWHCVWGSWAPCPDFSEQPSRTRGRLVRKPEAPAVGRGVQHCRNRALFPSALERTRMTAARVPESTGVPGHQVLSVSLAGGRGA